MERMEKQQTAVEWLVQNLKEQEYLGVFCTPDAWGREEEIMKGIVEQAKEMFKEQIINAASDHCYPTGELARIDAEDYYNETFKSE
jgi:hypothetical protein